MEDKKIIEENSRNYKMTLLYTQTRELQEKYNKELELSPSYYYLVYKKWLDDYKEKYNYKSIISKIENLDKYNNYDNIEKELSEKYNIDKNNLTIINSENVILNYFLYQTEHLEKYNLNVPKNIELINYKFFEDCLNNSQQIGFIKSDIYIGYQTILIVDNESRKKNKEVLFCCSLVQDEKDNYNFFIIVIYIIFFNDSICFIHLFHYS